MVLRLSITLLTVLFSITAWAAHIVGGDMYYECLGGNNYRVYLKVYRDCFSSGPNVADYDDPGYLSIYDANGFLIDDNPVFYSNRRNVPPETNNPCLRPPSNVCVEEASYIFDYTLPPSPGGYDIVYTRCCRNATIANINAPGDVGATYTVHIDPQTTPCNNSPFFNDFPPIVICAGEPLVFDHSATDPDGDVIVYELCTPYTGGDINTPQPIPSIPPPFGNVFWRNPYSLNNLLGGVALSINPNTGVLTGTPQLQGQFVVGICANEYRNGVLIGTLRRDFQFNVVACVVDVQATIPVYDTATTIPGVDGVYRNSCVDFTVEFANTSRGGITYFWDFGVTGIANDTSIQFRPTYTFPDTGQYVVTLILNKGTACSDTAKVLVRVFPEFFSDFNFVNVCEGEPLQLVDQSFSRYGIINQWSWFFSNGTGSSQQSPSVIFPQDGSYNITLVTEDDNLCIDTMTKSVTIYTRPNVNFDISPACRDADIVFNDLSTYGNSTFDNRQWFLNGNNVGGANPYIYQEPNLGPRSMKLIVESNRGCIDSLTKTYNVFDPPVVTIMQDTNVCFLDTIRLSAAGGIGYVWSPNIGINPNNVPEPFVSPPQTTRYVVTVTDTNGCTNKDSTLVTVNPLPTTDAGVDTFICVGDSYQLQGQNGVVFSWQPAALVSNPNAANPITTPNSSTTYYLTTFNQFGCDNVDSVFVEVQQPINAQLANPPDVCIYESIQLEVTDGKYFLWSPADGLNDTTVYNPIASPLQSTTYTVVVSNDCPQFTDTLTVDLTVHPLPTVDAGPDTTIYRDETVALFGTSNGLSFVWQPGTFLDDSLALNPLCTPFNTIDYVLAATSEYGCENFDTVRINVEVKNLLLVPNAFTPNQDGLNDVFRIIKTLNIERVLDVFVFNRWGQKVFEGRESSAFWDGTFKGQPQDIGVYVYVIRALTRDGDEIKETGNVTLLR